MTAYTQHQKMTELIKSERKITEAVLKAIQEMDSSKAYLELGYSSLFDYLTRAQKYSESAAQRRISAARLIKELPEITPQLQAGEINLTQLSKLAIAVKQEERLTGNRVQTSQKQALIAKLSHKTGFETEKLLSEELHYSTCPTERIKPQAEDVVLTLKLSKAQFEKLQKVKNYVSHAQHDACFAEIIETMCDRVIQKKEGPQKSTQTIDKSDNEKVNSKAASITAATAVKKNPRSPIPIHIQRQVFQRANYCCEYKSVTTGMRCQSPYQLQVDHFVPVAKGGGNKLENLRALCRGHNLSEAKRWGLTPKLKH